MTWKKVVASNCFHSQFCLYNCSKMPSWQEIFVPKLAFSKFLFQELRWNSITFYCSFGRWIILVPGDLWENFSDKDWSFTCDRSIFWKIWSLAKNKINCILKQTVYLIVSHDLKERRTGLSHKTQLFTF